VRAGLAGSVTEWRWSSLQLPNLIDPPPVHLPHDASDWLADPLPDRAVEQQRALINRPAL